VAGTACTTGTTGTAATACFLREAIQRAGDHETQDNASTVDLGKQLWNCDHYFSNFVNSEPHHQLERGQEGRKVYIETLRHGALDLGSPTSVKLASGMILR
jgi:hypothetical protein